MKSISNDRSMRKGIDHIGVSASFIIHDGKGKILLQKRGPKARDEQGAWDIGGGAIEFGETIEEAVSREVAEELSATPLEMEFLTVYDAHRVHGEHKTHWIVVIYSVKVDPSTVKIGEPDKISEIGWFNKRSLPTPLHTQFEKSYAKALERGIVT